MSDLPDILTGLPIHWRGVDDSTPPGCEMIATTVLGMVVTYVVRDGVVLGRIEAGGHGYVGDRLKGGTFIGSGLHADLAAKIAA